MTTQSENLLKMRVMPANTPAIPQHEEGAPFALRSGATVLRIVRGETEYCQDILAEEVPVALVYNGLSHAVMLASPDKLEDLGLGFSLTEGILESPQELYDVEVVAACQGVEVRMEISSRRFAALKERRRTLAGRTGCGLCGVDSLAAVARIDRPVQRRGGLVPAQSVARALVQMQELQELHRSTGAAHGVAWVSPEGEVLALREDMGRHNALDKLIGHLTCRGFDPASGFVLTSSRTSYEMVQKSVAVGIGMLVAVSAPTALAVRLAQDSNMTLAGFARGNRLVVYSHPEYLLAQGEA